MIVHPPLAHPSTPAWARDQLAIGMTALLSVAVLWFGSAGVQHLATQGILGSTRTHAAMGSLSPSSGTADYSMSFDHVIAPMRTDAAATIRSIRIEAEDLMPLPWGKGWL